MPQTILIVDDEPMIVKGLKFSLEQDGYATDVAYDGEEALEKFKNSKFDLIILDLMLPKIDGMQVCQTIRESSEVPIVMLTAKGEDMDKILGLEYGADDYMTKPFNILELKARIKTILRRAKAHVQPVQTITVRQLTVNLDQRSVQVDGKDVRLTVKEFELLKLLATNPGKIFSRDTLLETIWKYDYLGDLRTVDVHVRRLREKIERDPGQPEFILTKWGVGYYFTDA